MIQNKKQMLFVIGAFVLTLLLGSTTYDANYIDKTYARIDTQDNPGYLTLKTN